MGMLVVAAKLLSQNQGSMIKGALGFVIFAAAINVLVSAVRKLSDLSWDQLAKGLVGVGVLMTEIALFMKATDLNKMGILKGAGILLLAVAINILAKAVGAFADMDIGKMVQGLAAVGVVLAELALFINLTGDAKKVTSTAIGLTILGAAMLIFAKAIALMGSMSWEQLAKGLVGMAGALTIITVAVNLMPKTMLLSAVSLVVIAAALVILANALTTMGGMSWEEIGKSLVMLAGSLGIIAVAMAFMTTALPGAAALLVVAASLAILAQVVKVLGSMSLTEIGLSLLALVGIFAVIGVAGLVLGPVIPAMIGIGIAIALIGVGCMAAGGGLLAFSAGLAALAVSGTAGAAALVVIVTAIIGLIPVALQKIGEGIIAFAGVITAGMPALLEAIKALFAGIIQILGELAPPMIETVLKFILELLTKLVDYVPKFIDAGMKIIIGFLKGIADNIQAVVEAGIDIIVNFLKGVTTKLPDIIDAAFKLIIAFINGLADAIRDNDDAIFSAVKNLVDAIVDAFGKLIDTVIDVGKNIVNGIIKGISKMATAAWNAAKELGQNILNSVLQFFGIKSPSTLMRDEVGVYIVKGIAEGITQDMSAEDAAAKKAQNIVNAFKTELDKISAESQTSDLEYNLWDIVNGDSASATTKSAKEVENLSEKILLQQKKVELATGEYQTTLANFGADAPETRTAYNKMLQEQITLADLAKKLGVAMQTGAATNQAAMQEYYKILSNEELIKTLKASGFTQEQIEAYAKEKSGFDPTGKVAEGMVTDVKSAVTSAMKTVSSVYEKTADATFGGLLESIGDWGGQYATALGTGFLKAFDDIMVNIHTALDGIESALVARLSEISANIMNALANLNNLAPTITPVLDLSDVNDSLSGMSKTVTTTGITAGTSADRAAAIVEGNRLQNGSDSSSSTNKETPRLSFIQYNYSPKPLSRLEIYRQTKNLVSLKGL